MRSNGNANWWQDHMVHLLILPPIDQVVSKRLLSSHVFRDMLEGHAAWQMFGSQSGHLPCPPTHGLSPVQDGDPDLLAFPSLWDLPSAYLRPSPDQIFSRNSDAQADPVADASPAFNLSQDRRAVDPSQDRRGAILQCQQSLDSACQQHLQPPKGRDAGWTRAFTPAPASSCYDSQAISSQPGTSQRWHESATPGLPASTVLGIPAQMPAGCPPYWSALLGQPDDSLGQDEVIQAAPTQPILAPIHNGDAAQQMGHPAVDVQHEAEELFPAACSTSGRSSTALTARPFSAQSPISSTKQSTGSSTDAQTELLASIASQASPSVAQPAHSQQMPETSQVPVTHQQPQLTSAAARPPAHSQTPQPSLATVTSFNAPAEPWWLGQLNAEASLSERATGNSAPMRGPEQSIFGDTRAAQGVASPVPSGPKPEPSKPAKRRRGSNDAQLAASRIKSPHMVCSPFMTQSASPGCICP